MKFLVLLSAWGLLAKVFAATFSGDIAPVLENDCLACHSSEKAKGGYRVHNFEAVLKPGKSKKPAVIPGDPEKSEMFLRLITHDEDDRMPQDADPLSPQKIELFRAWIAQGAKLDRGQPTTILAELSPKQAHPAPPDLYPRPLPILSISFSRDGQQLAVGGYHEITFWNLEGELAARLTNAPQRTHSIAFQPGAKDNKFAVAGGKPGRSGELNVYANGILLTNLVRTADELLSLAFSADGTLLACGGADNSIRLFRTGSWEPITAIQQHADWVTSVSFNVDGTRILSASRDRTARIYDAKTGELETSYMGHGAALMTAAFLSEDKAASAGKEKAVHLWNITDGKKQNEVGGAAGEISAIIATKDHFFASSLDGKVRQYATRNRKLIRTFEGHRNAVYCIAFHEETGRLAAGAYDGTVIIWDTAKGRIDGNFVAAPLESTQKLNLQSGALGEGE